MPGRLLHVGATVRCPHQGTVTITAAQTKVTVGGKVVATTDSKLNVAACPFQVPVPSGTKPQPCTSATWAGRAAKVTAGGKPVLVGMPGTVPGVCSSADSIPQGPPVLGQVQQKVSGS